MTTPRDDIALHVRWLNDLATKGGKGVVNNIDARSLGRIATQLATLSARVKDCEERDRLKENRFAEWCCELEARALRAEQERDKAKAALKAEQSRGSYHCD